MISYITLEAFKSFLDDLEPYQADEQEAKLKRFILSASRTLENYVTNKIGPRRHFYPLLETRTYDHPVQSRVRSYALDTNRGIAMSRGNASFLELEQDLLELTTLTTKNGDTTITSADYLLLQGDRYDSTPYNGIQLDPDGTVTEFEYQNTPYQANSVAGIWGYHNDWASAWDDSGDTVQNTTEISASETALEVSDVDGNDINGLPNRFSSFQLLKIEDEYVWVTDADPDTNILTIRRGMLGTTAAIHANATAISIYRQMEDISLAMEMWSTHLYRRRDSIGTPDQRPLAAAKGLLVFPPSIPNEVKDVIDTYRKDGL